MEGQLYIANTVVNLFLMVPGFVAFVVKNKPIKVFKRNRIVNIE